MGCAASQVITQPGCSLLGAVLIQSAPHVARPQPGGKLRRADKQRRAQTRGSPRVLDLQVPAPGLTAPKGLAHRCRDRRVRPHPQRPLPLLEEVDLRRQQLREHHAVLLDEYRTGAQRDKLTGRGEGVGFEADAGRAQGTAQGRGGRGLRLGQQCLDERLAKQKTRVVTNPLNH